MKKNIQLTEKQLIDMIKKSIKEQDVKNDRYMFFSNLEQIHRQTGMMLEMEENELYEILENGHDWAQDHIATSKESIDQVFDFFMNETKGDDSEMSDYDDMGMMEEGKEITEKKKKNTPTNPKLWKQSLNWAKSRYKVCPSAYCNGAAVKHYNSKGGKWKKK
jgi:hypothetical protein